MGSNSNRSAGGKGPQHSGAAVTRSETASRPGAQIATGVLGHSVNAIEPITMRVPDACRYIGISRSTLYVLIAEGEIEIIKLGCSTLVLTNSLKALIAKRRGLAETVSAQEVV